MIIRHEHATQNDGKIIPLTRCGYTDTEGNHMMASFHGHISEGYATDLLKRLRAQDAQQKKA